jgi:carbohydrate kinase (thermoresistant glucokinase family)
MGVSGAGKTTVGRCLADRLRWRFQEGDQLHPPENVAKMQSGQPLTDCDRAPWLDSVAKVIDDWRDRGECGVITCSALRRNYRKRIVGDRSDVRLVYLDGSWQLIAQRLGARKHHFMPASLLQSQFATLEPPGPDDNPITVGIDRPVPEIVNHIVGALFPSAERPLSDCNAKGRT